MNPIASSWRYGGELSAVTESTRDIFLESAFFEPVALAGVARVLVCKQMLLQDLREELIQI